MGYQHDRESTSKGNKQEMVSRDNVLSAGCAID